jgi:heme A synthase
VTLWRILESVHGHLAVLAAAALIHPAILLRRGKPLSRGMKWSVALSALAVVAAFSTGIVLYKPYIANVRIGLFLRSVRAGMSFESKEHLAFAVIALVAGAAVCAWVAPRDARGLRRAAAVAFAVGAALCIVTVALGTYVTGVHGFASSK